jgi:hypothetical protein
VFVGVLKGKAGCSDFVFFFDFPKVVFYFGKLNELEVSCSFYGSSLFGFGGVGGRFLLCPEQQSAQYYANDEMPPHTRGKDTAK